MEVFKFERDVEAGEVINFEPGPSCQIKVEREDDDGNNTETMRQESNGISNERSLENTDSKSSSSEPGPSWQIKIEREDDGDETETMRQESDDISNLRPLETVNENTLSEPGPSHQIKIEREEDKNETQAMRQESDHISNKRPVENTANESISNEPGPSSQIKIEREDDGNETGTMRQATDDILNKRPLENTDNESTSTKRIKLEPSDNLITFKVYLLQHDAKKEQGSEIKPDEVHKFHLDKDTINFTSLNEKITTVCPVLQEKSFTLTWKDEDGDDIVISSDEALDIAIAEQSLIKKINIKLDNAEEDKTKTDDCSAAPKDEMKIVHKNIICDHCNKLHFQGLRYTCIACPDFDLCSKCEAKGVHLQHMMVRLTKPFRPFFKKEKLLELAKTMTFSTSFESEVKKKRRNPKKGLKRGRKPKAVKQPGPI